jgi:hypothetical protein
VPVLHRGPLSSPEALHRLIGNSSYITESHETRLREQCARHGQDFGRVWRETDQSRLMEGLYLKDEEGGITRARFKFVRSGFLQVVLGSGSHWSQRPLLPNLLRPGVDLFA